MTAVVPVLFLGQPAMRVVAPDGAQATVLLHGAHVVSWIPAGGDEQLYLSPTARYGLGAAVRGGVPVIFPQFNQRGPLPRHGLVRTREWQAVTQVVRGEHALGVLKLGDDMATRTHWPHGFEIELTVSVAGQSLEMELAVSNTGDTAFDFHAALHTYLRVNDALRLQLEGLQDCDYEDALLGESHRQWGDVLTLVGPIDRVYHAVRHPLTLREMGRRTRIEMTGFEDVVVWNPGMPGAAALSDMPDDDWQQMLCVEAARIRQPVHLAPGEDWFGRQSLFAAG